MRGGTLEEPALEPEPDAGTGVAPGLLFGV